jgi:hypothetical protein
MTAQIIDGKAISEKLLCEIAADVETMQSWWVKTLPLNNM